LNIKLGIIGDMAVISCFAWGWHAAGLRLTSFPGDIFQVNGSAKDTKEFA
jgi:hypothetical protein